MQGVEHILHPPPTLSLHDDVHLELTIVDSRQGGLTLVGGGAVSSSVGGSCASCQVLTFGCAGVGLAATGRAISTLDGSIRDDVLPLVAIHAHRAGDPGSTVVVAVLVLSRTQEGQGHRWHEAALVGGGGVLVVMGTVLSHMQQGWRILDEMGRGGEM